MWTSGCWTLDAVLDAGRWTVLDTGRPDCYTGFVSVGTFGIDAGSPGGKCWNFLGLCSSSGKLFPDGQWTPPHPPRAARPAAVTGRCVSTLWAERERPYPVPPSPPVLLSHACGFSLLFSFSPSQSEIIPNPPHLRHQPTADRMLGTHSIPCFQHAAGVGGHHEDPTCLVSNSENVPSSSDHLRATFDAS
jgi:hypothetical protein